MFIVFSVNVMIINEPFSGTIHSNERPLHEERPRLRASLLDHRPGDVQRPDGASRSNNPRQRHSRCANDTRRKQVRLGRRTSCVQRPGPAFGQAI